MKKDVRILFYDLETSPMVLAGFGLYDTTIPTSNVLQDWTIFSAAWKYLGEDKVYSISTAEYTEEQVVTAISSAIHAADIIVAHNGDKFDIKKLRTRILSLGLQPLTQVCAIDTLKVAKKNFKFTSNRLDYLARALGVGAKMTTSEGLWIRALKGDKNALLEMERYNRQDVEVLEKVYLKMRPYIDNHPSVARILNNATLGGCPACGSVSTHRHDKQLAQKRVYQRYRCQDCGGVFKGEVIKEIQPKEI